jgi:hypothetical protein
MDSSKLQPLTCEDTIIPIITISRPFGPRLLKCSSSPSPTKSNSPKNFISIDLYGDKVKSLGELLISTNTELINNFNTGEFTMGFWTNIQSKTLGTFLVVTTPDSKMHLVSMRRKIFGCNYQYDFIKNCIRTINCNCCELNSNHKIQEPVYYEFPNEVIILTPVNPYEVPKILSKM